MRKTYFFLTVFFLCPGYLLNSVYRPYVYVNKLKDFGLSDMGNNLVFVPGIYFLCMLVRNKPFSTYFVDVLLILGIYLCVEVLQLFDFVPGTFDFLDIVGLIGGAIVTFILSKKIHNF